MPELPPEQIVAWAKQLWPGGPPDRLEASPLPVDGSVRTFARLAGNGVSLVVMCNPGQRQENTAWLVIGRHLAGLGVGVPAVLAHDPALGLHLMEDLGDQSLQDAVLRAPDQAAVARLYEPALAQLALLQARGAEGFDDSLCFDGPALDAAFLRRREMGYFVEEYVRGACGLDQPPADLGRDLDEAARRAGEARPWGLAHRDFQSRNLMVRPSGQLGVVDFQGARLGPAQYDLASLLHDPYVDLPWETRQRLLERYLELRAAQGPLDAEEFMAGWPWVSLSRLMQALGAYAFLTRKRGRTHFAAHARPALASLRRVLDEPACAGLTALRGLVERLPAWPPEDE